MTNLEKVVLIQTDSHNQILDVKGPYSYMDAVEILEKGHKKLGGKLHVQTYNHDWAMQWDYEDSNETCWTITPIETEFEYPEDLD